MRPIRVLVADDHPEMLSALASAIEADPRFTVVSTATNGTDALRRAESHGVDLVVLDVRMPDGGPPAAAALAGLARPPVVVAISAEANGRLAEEMERAGAAAVLTKGKVGAALPDLLAEAVRNGHPTVGRQ